MKALIYMYAGGGPDKRVIKSALAVYEIAKKMSELNKAPQPVYKPLDKTI